MAVFKKYEVIVHRPKSIENYNQIFSRDTAFVIEDKLIIANNITMDCFNPESICINVCDNKKCKLVIKSV